MVLVSSARLGQWERASTAFRSMLGRQGAHVLEAQRASMFSIFAIQILDEIRDRYGPVADVDGCFNSELIR